MTRLSSHVWTQSREIWEGGVAAVRTFILCVKHCLWIKGVTKMSFGSVLRIRGALGRDGSGRMCHSDTYADMSPPVSECYVKDNSSILNGSVLEFLGRGWP